jgi:predicted ArsR family transcriptional regulator
MADATISPAALRIIKLLVGKPPQSVQDLTAAAGVTRNAVNEQLHELEQAGFVKRSIERLTGRGRPRNRFEATHAALLLLSAGKDCLVGNVIWDAIQEVGGDELTDKVLAQVSRDVADKYRARITAKTPAGRLKQMGRVLRDEGLLVDITEEQDRMSLCKRSCAYIGMFEERRRVCTVDEQILSLVVGAPVHMVASRHDGQPCCVFQLDKKAK